MSLCRVHLATKQEQLGDTICIYKKETPLSLPGVTAQPLCQTMYVHSHPVPWPIMTARQLPAPCSIMYYLIFNVFKRPNGCVGRPSLCPQPWQAELHRETLFLWFVSKLGQCLRSRINLSMKNIMFLNPQRPYSKQVPCKLLYYNIMLQRFGIEDIEQILPRYSSYSFQFYYLEVTTILRNSVMESLNAFAEKMFVWDFELITYHIHDTASILGFHRYQGPKFKNCHRSVQDYEKGSSNMRF